MPAVVTPGLWAQLARLRAEVAALGVGRAGAERSRGRAAAARAYPRDAEGCLEEIPRRPHGLTREGMAAVVSPRGSDGELAGFDKTVAI